MKIRAFDTDIPWRDVREKGTNESVTRKSRENRKSRYSFSSSLRNVSNLLRVLGDKRLLALAASYIQITANTASSFSSRTFPIDVSEQFAGDPAQLAQVSRSRTCASLLIRIIVL